VQRAVRCQQSKREPQRGQQSSQRWFRDASQIAGRAVQLHDGRINHSASGGARRISTRISTHTIPRIGILPGARSLNAASAPKAFRGVPGCAPIPLRHPQQARRAVARGEFTPASASDPCISRKEESVFRLRISPYSGCSDLGREWHDMENRSADSDGRRWRRASGRVQSADRPTLMIPKQDSPSAPEISYVHLRQTNAHDAETIQGFHGGCFTRHYSTALGTERSIQTSACGLRFSVAPVTDRLQTVPNSRW
jgi:hypothetical protein